MDDIAGIGKGAEKLLSVLETATGAVYRDFWGRRRAAELEANRVRLLGETEIELETKRALAKARAKAASDQIRAESEERIEARSAERQRRKRLHEQMNVDVIVLAAAERAREGDPVGEPSAAWLNDFLDSAQRVSDEDMQQLWAAVLAREIGQPGTISMRSLEMLRRLTREEAILFEQFCRCATRGDSDDLNPMLVVGATSDRWWSISETRELELASFGLQLMTRMRLAEIGLIYEKELLSGPHPVGGSTTLYFARTGLVLKARRAKVRLRAFALTPEGAELAATLPTDESPEFIESLGERLSKYFSVESVSMHEDVVATQ